MWTTAFRFRKMQLAAFLAMTCAFFPGARVSADFVAETARVAAAGFVLGKAAAIQEGSRRVLLSLDQSRGELPFNQSAVKQSTAPASRGPNLDVPYFAVRFALPIPPDNETNLVGGLVGLDEAVWAHNHSPGFEVLPNGDLLAVYFSARMASGSAESAVDTRFVQARLRHGAKEWDMPELFCDFEGMNDQSALLWRDGNTVRFFGGGRGASPWLPFKMAVSTNNGATWELSVPVVDKPASDFTAQPIANAFRGVGGAMYFAMDAADDHSFLWRSDDDGIHWRDSGGRTGARHSTIVPLDDAGHLLSIGGKNTSLDGWSPMNTSDDGGATWSASQRSPFSALGSNQRPCLIRLANGHLCMVTDSYSRKTGNSPEGWALGEGCFVAISKDDGRTWHFKRLPVELPHEKDRKFGTLGYSTVRQAPNGLLHVLATMTHPCLHYEFNEAWVYSDAGDLAPEGSGGKAQRFREDYPNGKPRVKWTARICFSGRYLLDGKETSYYANGRKEHEVTYTEGRKTGSETFWAEGGTKLWSWKHNPNKNTSTWTHFLPNGRKRVESTWNTSPQARDLARNFCGFVAHGPVKHLDERGRLVREYKFTNGALSKEVSR